MPAVETPAWAGSCSKAIRGCPGKAGTKSGAARSPKSRPQKRESRRVGTRRLPYVGDRVGGLGVRPPPLGPITWCLEMLFASVLHVHRATYRTAVGAAGAPVVVAHAATVIAAHSRAIMAAHVLSARAAQAAQHRKAPLLVVVEALVERICGVGQFLQCRTRVRHGCGALPQALDRIVGGR